MKILLSVLILFSFLPFASAGDSEFEGISFNTLSPKTKIAAQKAAAIILRDCADIKIKKKDLIKFYDTITPLKEQKELLTLVDKTHNIGTYAPDNLENIKTNISLTPEAAKALRRMIAQAGKDGVRLYPVSAYRSYQYQEKLFQRGIAISGRKHTDMYIARPGASQHQLGTAVDLNTTEEYFETTKEFKWLSENAGKFGFSLSFPKGAEEITGYAYEPWHYRYIGKDAVKAQNEFFQGSQQRLLEFLNKCLF